MVYFLQLLIEPQGIEIKIPYTFRGDVILLIEPQGIEISMVRGQRSKGNNF